MRVDKAAAAPIDNTSCLLLQNRSSVDSVDSPAAAAGGAILCPGRVPPAQAQSITVAQEHASTASPLVVQLKTLGLSVEPTREPSASLLNCDKDQVSPAPVQIIEDFPALSASALNGTLTPLVHRHTLPLHGSSKDTIQQHASSAALAMPMQASVSLALGNRPAAPAAGSSRQPHTTECVVSKGAATSDNMLDVTSAAIQSKLALVKDRNAAVVPTAAAVGTRAATRSRAAATEFTSALPSVDAAGTQSDSQEVRGAVLARLTARGIGGQACATPATGNESSASAKKKTPKPSARVGSASVAKGRP